MSRIAIALLRLAVVFAFAFGGASAGVSAASANAPPHTALHVTATNLDGVHAPLPGGSRCQSAKAACCAPATLAAETDGRPDACAGDRLALSRRDAGDPRDLDGPISPPPRS